MDGRKYIVDLFEDVVSNVRALYDPTNGLEPYYDHGHPVSILNKLSIKDGSKVLKFRKYPLIILVQDIQENYVNNLGVYYTVSPRIVIMDKSDKNYTEQERYENVFKPVLYPIWELLIEEIQDYKYFKFDGYVEYQKFDRVYWGTSTIFGNEGTILNDFVDGIELLFEPINITRNQGSLCQ
jgi:hypothetical protein